MKYKIYKSTPVHHLAQISANLPPIKTFCSYYISFFAPNTNIIILSGIPPQIRLQIGLQNSPQIQVLERKIKFWLLLSKANFPAFNKY